MIPHNVDQFEIPAELSVKPLCLIGVAGLDTVNNAVHKTIWDAFNGNRRVERAPITFKLLSNSHEFPVIKPKRNSYEWYIPKGILKRNWMNKHLNEIPAVIVIFYDLDWNDSHWNEKMIECSSRVQSMRAALEGRNTRITVVLVQQTLPLPAGEDVLAAERAAALCASCELNAKSLFVLPLGDHLQGYTVRLENAFYDLAQNYYMHESRNVKSHRDHLNKTTHQYLFVRHQFKMGFLNELKQDIRTAHKHYTHAYNNLLELRIVDTNALEIKTVAGFINYKLCKLMFALSLPREAISQFRAHFEKFRLRIGFRELTFEHYAWLANQYTIFGDIFDEAVKLGLPAVQTQHPGFYYQQAAQYAIMRKQACLEHCKDATSYPSPDPLEGIENMEFYGQRPWRPGKLSAEPPDPHKEQAGIQALQYLERQVNHSSIIISFYGLAIAQFKTYKCPRMRRHLVVQMADEYYNSCDYGKALTLLTHMLWDYRNEGWWNIISDILQRALNCSYLAASIQDYVSISLEMLGENIGLPVDTKRRIFQNLTAVLKKTIPEPESDLAPAEAQKAIGLWKTSVSAEPLDISVDMSNIGSCVDSKARFTRNSYEADQSVAVEIFIKSTCLQPLRFARLSVTINTANYTSEFAVAENGSANPSLLFESNQVKKFVVDFVPDVQDVGQEIQIGAILLRLGNENEHSVVLRFNGNGANHNASPESAYLRSHRKGSLDFDSVKPLSAARIVPRLSKVGVEVEHAQPALVGEWYPVKVVVSNAEALPIKDVRVRVTMEIDEVGPELATEFCTDPEKPDRLPLLLDLPDLDVGASSSSSFYIRSHRTGDRNITLKLSYLFKAEKNVESMKEENVSIPVGKPFDVSAKYFSRRFEPISKFFAREPFIVMPQVKCCSPWPVVVESTVVEFNKNSVRTTGSAKADQLVDLKLQNEETGSEVYCVQVEKSSDQPVALGSYTVHWRREGGAISNTTKVAIKGLVADEFPLYVDAELPAHGYIRTPMPASYSFYNRSCHLLQLDLVMDANETFMFSGYRQIQMTIMPKSQRTIKYNLYPLVSGNVMLPKLKLVVNDRNIEICSLQQPQVNELLERCVPTHVYIMPQVKGNPVSPAATETTRTTAVSP